MPYQKNRADNSYYAQKMPTKPENMNAAYYGGMQGTGCGCGGKYQARPTAGCTLAAPAPHVPACMPAAFHMGCCGVSGGASWGGVGGGAYHRMKDAYGY